jgi:HIRAN domain
MVAFAKSWRSLNWAIPPINFVGQRPRSDLGDTMRRESGSATRLRLANLLGNGQYSFAVVGESHHQIELEEIVGGRTEESADFECAALLVSEPDNSFDPNAIMVFITGEKVGYLPRKAAARYNEARQAHGIDLAVCDATIVGGWDRGDDDVGHFGVRLDVSQPFRFENIRDWQPPAGQAAAQQPTRRSRYSAVLAVLFICAGAMAWYVMTSPSAPRATVATDYPLKPSQAPAWTGAITEASAAPLSKAEPIVADQARETVPLPRPRPATGPLRLVRSP